MAVLVRQHRLLTDTLVAIDMFGDVINFIQAVTISNTDELTKT